MIANFKRGISDKRPLGPLGFSLTRVLFELNTSVSNFVSLNLCFAAHLDCCVFEVDSFDDKF